MGKKIGRLINVGIANEATRGTAVAPTNWLPKSNITFYDRVTKAPSEVGYGVIGDGNQELVALKWAEGDIECDLISESFGVILKSLFGTISSGAYETSAYEHTFSIQNDNAHDSMTIWVEDDVESNDIFFPLAMVDSLTLSIAPEDVVKSTVGFIAKSSQDTSDLSSSYAAETKFVGRHASLKIADATGDLNAASRLDVRSMDITINKNVMRDHSIGTVHPVDIVNQKIEITGKIVLDLEDDTYKDYMLNGTYKAMRLLIENTDVTIGSAGNPSFMIELSRVAFDGWEPTRENDAIATQTINFRALYDISNGNIINDCHLRNTTASY